MVTSLMNPFKGFTMPLPSATLSPSTYRYMYPSLPNTATIATPASDELDTGSST